MFYTIKHFEEPIDQAEKVTIKVAVADIVHNSNFARVNGVLCLLLCSRIVDSTSLLLFFYSTWLKPSMATEFNKVRQNTKF